MDIAPEGKERRGEGEGRQGGREGDTRKERASKEDERRGEGVRKDDSLKGRKGGGGVNPPSSLGSDPTEIKTPGA